MTTAHDPTLFTDRLRRNENLQQDMPSSACRWSIGNHRRSSSSSCIQQQSINQSINQ